MFFKVYLMRQGGRRLRSSETFNAPACIGEQELTGGQSANPAIWPTLIEQQVSHGQRIFRSAW